MEGDSFTIELGWLATVRLKDQEDGVMALEGFVQGNVWTMI
jgi:hypothetical protein